MNYETDTEKIALFSVQTLRGETLTPLSGGEIKVLCSL